jgi:hypothetical protein
VPFVLPPRPPADDPMQFQKLLDKHIAEVDQILAGMKKTTGAK